MRGGSSPFTRTIFDFLPDPISSEFFLKSLKILDLIAFLFYPNLRHFPEKSAYSQKICWLVCWLGEKCWLVTHPSLLLASILDFKFTKQ